MRLLIGFICIFTACMQQTEVPVSVSEKTKEAAIVQVVQAEPIAKTKRKAIAEIPPARVVPLPTDKVDEAYLIYRILDEMLRDFPSLDWDEELYSKVLLNRTFTERLLFHAKSTKLDATAIAFLNLQMQLYSEFDQYLIRIGAVNQEMLDRTQKERQELIELGIDRSKERVQENRGKENATTENLRGAGQDVLIGAIVDFFQRKEREKERQEAIDLEKSRFRDLVQTTRKRLQEQAKKAATTFSWTAFDLDQNTIAVEKTIEARPKDPFLKYYAASNVAKRDFATLSRFATYCLSAAQQLPEATAYLALRKQFLYRAADLAAEAMEQAWKEANHQFPDGGFVAEIAISIGKAAYELEKDNNYVAKVVYAKILHYTGYHEDAYSRMTTPGGPKPQDAENNFLISCILVEADYPIQALTYLKLACQANPAYRELAGKDVRLKKLQVKEPVKFQQAVQP